ncbi:hypothetical protein [Neorhizobium tomejilense]|uniref:hypothetical protein n=1 Tax=Neorhizobium tomejilense TaxID=2093828 RepID=UPI003ED03E41
MSISRLSALGLLAGLCLASSAHTAEFRSTYSETLSCPVKEEGDDAFLRECTGPGNVRAVLQYVEGLFGVFYLPMGGKTPLQREDMLEISPNARHPYGNKLEWLQRVGDAAPCAAIIRVYTTEGEVLVLNELSTGNRIGLVKTNKLARALADRFCSDAVLPAAAEANITPSVAPPAVPSESWTDDVATAAQKGKARFMQIYTQTGISGAIEEVEQCYRDFDNKPSMAKLTECGAIDLTAADADSSVMAGMPGLKQVYLANGRPASRISEAMKRLNLDPETRSVFHRKLAASLGKSVSSTDEPKKEAESVFDFSK